MKITYWLVGDPAEAAARHEMDIDFEKADSKNEGRCKELAAKMSAELHTQPRKMETHFVCPSLNYEAVGDVRHSSNEAMKEEVTEQFFYDLRYMFD